MSIVLKVFWVERGALEGEDFSSTSSLIAESLSVGLEGAGFFGGDFEESGRFESSGFWSALRSTDFVTDFSACLFMEEIVGLLIGRSGRFIFLR